MNELTLESLAARIEALERESLERKIPISVAVIPATRDLFSVIGMFEGSEFMPSVDAEVEAMIEKERKEAQRGMPS